MKKKKVSFLEKFLHLFLAVLSIVISAILLSSYPKLQSVVIMFVSVLWIVDILWLFSKDTYHYFGLYISFMLGSTLLFLFCFWLGNIFLKLFNPIFMGLNINARVGNVFNDTWHFLFSFPSLISGLFLLFVSFRWDNRVDTRIWQMLKKEPRIITDMKQEQDLRSNLSQIMDEADYEMHDFRDMEDL